ncbi:hypothetical protein ABER68_04150 [Paenibacillus alvei]
MTMILAYIWNDKIVTMADSRASKRDHDGKMIYKEDNSIKIKPISKRFVVAHSGLYKVHRGNEQYANLYDITDLFIERNQNNLSTCNGIDLFEGLVDSWNQSLERLGKDPYSINNRFSFFFSEWENVDGLLFPRIHAYQSHKGEFNVATESAVAGDEEIYPLIKPYLKVRVEEMTLEESIEYFKKGYEEVCSKVDTVGGFIHVHILDANPLKSYWFSRKIFDL